MVDWVSAVSALGALVAAIWAVRTSMKLFGVETARDECATERRKLEQASGIAAWCVYCPENPTGSQSGILVHNSSDAPVFDVTINASYSRSRHVPAEPLPPLTLSIVPPGDFVSTAHSTYNWTFPEERASITGTVRPVMKNENWKVTNISFTDAHGIRWVRTGGALQELAEPASV